MIKMITSFVCFWAAFAIGIDLFMRASGKEKFEFIKLMGYAIMCSVITVFFLAGIVFLF